jgi:hypothetical protein
MTWLLDTNILSEGRKPRPEPRVTAFYEAQPLNDLYISASSISLNHRKSYTDIEVVDPAGVASSTLKPLQLARKDRHRMTETLL